MLGRNFANLEILELIGLGGSAEVYRAVDLNRNCEVAVKVLVERAEPEMLLRFVREGKALARLHHPNIIQVYEMGEEQGHRYIAMELVSGGSLKERLQKNRIPWREAVHIAIQVARALEHAHASQIVHRDVKPGNIMFDAQGHVKLTDFGLAYLSDASTMTRTGTVMGTVFYLSPEQALGRHVDGRSDLYALGAVLYEMLTGQPPFTGPSAVSIIYKHLNEQPLKLRQSGSSLPGSLEVLVDRLLQKDPERRFQNAEETIVALESVLQAPQQGAPVPGLPADLLADEGATLATPLVPLAGRKAELAALTAALERAISGVGRTVFVLGEAGMGKTRLAQELQRLARERNVLPLVGECLYSDAPSPYAPFVQIVRAYEEQHNLWWGNGHQQDAFDAREAEAAAALREVRAVLRLSAPGIGDEHNGWLRNASAQDAQAHVFECISQFFQSASHQRPLLLILEDLQWASPTTLQLLHYLARNVRGTRILLVGCFRPEDILPGVSGETHPLQELLRRMSRERLYEEIALSPLDEQDTGQLTADVLGLSPLDPDFASLLYRESEGNPFYLLESLRLLQEQGVLERVGEHWELGATVDEIDIPGTVYDVVMRRVERATSEYRELLDWAAVAGQRLDVGVLMPLVGGSRLEVIRRLHALEQRYGLITADETGFAFAHHKVREVLYDQMPVALRREYHLMVGEVLEQLAADAPDLYTYDLARHFVQGGQNAKGFRYTLQAADKAEASFAPAEAVTYLAQALSLAERMAPGPQHAERQLTLQHRYARLLGTVGRQDDACAAFDGALALSRELGNRHVEADVLLDLGRARGRVGDWDSAIALGEQSLQVADGLRAVDPVWAAHCQASALLSTAFFAFERGVWEEAMARLQKALAVAQEHGQELLQARILGNMGILFNARGERAEAVKLYQQSIDTFARLEQPLDVGRGLSNMGFSYYGLGDYAAAMRCYGEALDHLNKVGDVREQGLVYLHMAELALAQGALADARGHCAQATRRFTRLGYELGGADVDRIYAGVARREARWAVAERYLREAMAVYEEHGDQLNLAEVHEELGQLLAEMGEHQTAEEELHRSRTMFQTLLGQDAEPHY